MVEDDPRAGLIIESEWPERLRRGVHSALRFCDVEQADWNSQHYDVHHIVAAGLDGAAPARHLLARWSISVHSVVNAAIVPRSFHQGQGLHRHEFLHSINMRLSSSALFADAVVAHGGFGAGRLIMLQSLQKIGIELVARSEDVVAVRLQSALQGLVARSASTGRGGGGLRSDGQARATVRGSRAGYQASAPGARLESAPIPRSRRSGPQFAAACP